MSRILVIGGGITGQLVQLVDRDAVICDWGPAPDAASGRLTRQFGANYLWAPIPGVKCRKFDVVTHIDGNPATVTSVAAYKVKIGKGHEDPVEALARQFPLRMHGFDFEERLPVSVIYGRRAIEVNLRNRRVVWADGNVTKWDVLVNTIPLPAFLSLIRDTDVGQRLTNRLGSHLTSTPIFVKITPRPPDAPLRSEILYVNYLSDPDVPPYRYCDRFGDRHYEGLTPMGTIANKKLVPGKINDLPPELNQELRYKLGQQGVYCFGRYARWQSDELVHETYRDLQTWRTKEIGL